MALIFPPNPEIGDEYIGDNGITYVWDGVKWAGQLTQGSVSGGGAIIEVRQEGITVSTATGIFDFVGAGVAVTSTNTTLVTVTIEAEPLTTATTATLGGVIIGDGITITDGVISVREGLEYWAENKLVIDNSQTSVVSLIALGTETNVSAIIKAQGSGAVGNDDAGNTRGAYAVDWQRIRSNNTQVASGDYAVISGGSFNQASGLHSVIIGGNNNVNDAEYSVILGGVNGNTRGIDGAVIMPHYATGGASNSSGKIQSGYYLLSGDTLQSTSPIDLTTDGSGNISASNQITLVDNSAIYFKGTVVAKEINTPESPEIAVWEITGTAYRRVGNTTTNLVSIVVPTLINSTTSTSWQLTVSTENNLGCILIQAQGTADQQIRWVAKIETVEVADAGM
jgi:hypothetical protein